MYIYKLEISTLGSTKIRIVSSVINLVRLEWIQGLQYPQKKEVRGWTCIKALKRNLINGPQS